MVNGMCCTRLVESEVMLSDVTCEWYLDYNSFDYDKERKKAFLLPQWGIYICAYSRFRILESIYQISDGKGRAGNQACYSDTDSIKYVGNHDEFIEVSNKATRLKMKEVCERYNLDYSLFYDLGSFEKEYGGRGVRAKFLGAKRYIIEQDGEYYTTIAGLPKKALAGYVAGRKIQWEIYQYGDYPTTFSIFTDKMLLSADVSLKNAHTYNDEPHAGTINGVGVFELSSVGIYPIDFTMKLAPYYMTLITMLNERTEHYEDRIYY